MSASDLIAEYVTEPLELTSTELPGAAPAEPGANPLPGYQSLRGEEGRDRGAAPRRSGTGEAIDKRHA